MDYFIFEWGCILIIIRVISNMASLCQLIECCVVVGSESQSSPVAVRTGCAVRGWIYCFEFFLFSDHSVKLYFVSIVHTTELEVNEVLQYIVGLFRRVCYVELEQHASDKAMLLIAASPCRFTVLQNRSPISAVLSTSI